MHTHIAYARPTLLVDEGRVRRNIREMAERVAAAGIRFRPHFKTHQSADVGEWFREVGVSAITVSSVPMADYFASHGWDDITIASPINVRDMDALNALAQRITLHVTVDSVDAVEHLERDVLHPVSVWIEINTGDNRTGVEPSDRACIARVAGCIVESGRLTLGGLIAHDGQTYQASTVEEIVAIYRSTTYVLGNLAEYVWEETEQRPLISIGDTPTGKLIDNLGDIDELRPGNFVFFDLTQLEIGSCCEEDIAVALACPVVSKSTARREIVLHAGAVRLSLASLPGENDEPTFGRIVRLCEDGWGPMLPGCHVSRLSQELAVVSMSAEVLASVKVGDVLGVLPVHSCLTVDAMKQMQKLDGSLLPCFRDES